MVKGQRALIVVLLNGIENVVVLSGPVASVLSVIENACIAEVVDRTVVAAFRRNDLNVAVAWQKFHVWRAVEQNFARNRRQRVGQVAELLHSVGETAVVLKLAHARLFEIATHLGLVVRVDCSHVVASRIVIRHRLNKKELVSPRHLLTSFMLRFSWSPCANEQASPSPHVSVS